MGALPDTIKREDVRGLMTDAEAAESFEEAYRLVAEAVTTQLLYALKAAKVRRADKQVDALRASGLEQLLMEAWMRGKLTRKMVAGHINRLRTFITDRTTAEVAKNGILAFDDAAQRLSLVAGADGPFNYAIEGNHARDSLITFARALHR